MNTSFKTQRTEELSNPMLFIDPKEAQDFADLMVLRGNKVLLHRPGVYYEVTWEPLEMPGLVEFSELPIGPRQRFDLVSAQAEQASASILFVALGAGFASGFVWREIFRFVLSCFRG